MRRAFSQVRSRTGLSRRLAAQGAWALASEVIVVAGASANFILLATVLPEEEYGIVGSIQALSGPMAILGLMGAPVLLIRRLSRGADWQRSWAAANTLALFGTLAASALLLLLKPVLLGPAPFAPYVLLVLTYGALMLQHDMLYSFTIAVARLDLGVLVRVIGVGPRLVALGLFTLNPESSLEVWAWYIFVANVFSVLGGLALAKVAFGIGPSLVSPRRVFYEARQGAGYAMNGASEGVLDASDRPVLVNSGFAAEAGYYTLASRLILFSFMPAIALMRATTPQLFQAGAGGVASAFTVARKIVPPMVVVGAVTSGSLFLAAPLLHLFLPDRLSPTIDILRWLAVVPALKGVQYLGGNVLDASGHQMKRFWMTMGAAGLNLSLNVVFIPLFSWRAAVASTIVAEALLCVWFWGYVSRVARSERRVTGPGAMVGIDLPADVVGSTTLNSARRNER